jgi:hypothetical protein
VGDRAAGDTATDEANEDDAFRRLQVRYGEMKKRNLVLQARVDELEAATAAAASEKRELASALTKAENRADDAASHNKVIFFRSVGHWVSRFGNWVGRVGHWVGHGEWLASVC